MKEYHKKNRHRLNDGKIWTWKTDNGGEFRGDVIDGIGGLAEELVEKRAYSVPNAKNCNPEAERASVAFVRVTHMQRHLITYGPGQQCNSMHCILLRCR